MDWLRENSVRHGQRMCGMSAMVDEVTVQRTPEGRANFGGLLTCGSRTCPNCGPRIAAATRTEIEQAIAAWMPKPVVGFHDETGSPAHGEPTTLGHRLWFGTFTIRHHKGQEFAELADAVSKCWAAATGGRGWMRDREAHGIAHYLRVFEQKVSTRNGWHIHVHVLFFIDDTTLEDSDHTGLLASMFKRWSRKAIALGFGVPLIRAQDLHQVDQASALDRIADYFAKETTDASDAHPGSIGAEMTNAAGKQGIKSLTPGQLLAWAMEGEAYIAQLWGPASPRARGRGLQGREFARLLYRQYELGMKGRRSIAWSHGMREALGLGAELTDAELAERQERADAATRDTVVAMSGADYRKFNARPGRRSELINRAEAGASPGELVSWLAGFGVTASPHRKGREADDTGPEWFADLPTPF